MLKLDQRIPVVWRNPFDLQFGISPPRAILREVSPEQESVIAALRTGVTRSGLAMIARIAGMDDAQLVHLLAKLSRVIQHLPDAARADPASAPATAASAAALTSASISVVGRGPTVHRIARSLGDSGHRVATSTGAPLHDADLAIVVGHYVLDPALYGHWLRRDIPHLPVIFGDNEVVVGPMIEPGSGPCLFCLERYRAEADPVWPAIAAQLWGRRSHAETALTSRETAVRVTRLVSRRLASGMAAAATSVHLDPNSGTARLVTWRAHPECGCIALSSSTALTGAELTSSELTGTDPASAARPGTGSAGETVRGGAPLPPTTTGVSAWRA